MVLFGFGLVWFGLVLFCFVCLVWFGLDLVLGFGFGFGFGFGLVCFVLFVLFGLNCLVEGLGFVHLVVFRLAAGPRAAQAGRDCSPVSHEIIDGWGRGTRPVDISRGPEIHPRWHLSR